MIHVHLLIILLARYSNFKHEKFFNFPNILKTEKVMVF